MKYISPKYEIDVFKTESILTASTEKYEITEGVDEGGNSIGNVIMSAFDLFK